jgi:thymidine phosphorylase
VREAIAYLRDEAPIDPRLDEVTMALASELLVIGGLAATTEAATDLCRWAIESGAAAERFSRMVEALGGPADLLEDPERHLPDAPIVRALPAPRRGFVAGVDTRAIGLAIVSLGGGRRRVEDAVDHAVGLSKVAPIGSEVGTGARPLCVVHARNEAGFEAAAAEIRAAITIGESAPPSRPAILDRLD